MAVYTQVTDEDLIEFLSTYDLGKLLSCKGIAEGVENSNFYLHTSAGNFILTLYEKRVHEEDLPFFLGLMGHLAKAGVTCPLPVLDRRGAALGRLAGRPAAIVTFLDGYSLHLPEPKHCRAVGAALARLHLAGADFSLRRANTLSLSGWRSLFEQHADRAHTVQPGLAELVTDELAFLFRAWPKDLPQGVVHADLFPDNVLFLDDELSGLIDFYFACNDMLAYDLMICLNAWCFDESFAYDARRGRALFEGYRAIRSLSATEHAALPVLARGAALRFLLTRFVDWLDVPAGAMVRPKDPREYLAKLRFHRTVEKAEDYGA
ncbi:MAG TPA: homoserine kinase [Methylocystis sp.]|nr:homoserine kinase [Methylocystis sp.]